MAIPPRYTDGMAAPPPPGDVHERDCPQCGGRMAFTGLPDVAGPVNVRFYRCPDCGIVKVPVDESSKDGWG